MIISSHFYTQEFKNERRQVTVNILQIGMWSIGMAKETRLGCLVHIVQRYKTH